MHYRKLGKTNFNVSEVSLGAWQIGGGWGDVPDTDAERVLHSASDSVPLKRDQMAVLAKLYTQKIGPFVHQRW